PVRVPPPVASAISLPVVPVNVAIFDVSFAGFVCCPSRPPADGGRHLRSRSHGQIEGQTSHEEFAVTRPLSGAVTTCGTLLFQKSSRSACGKSIRRAVNGINGIM